MVLKRAGRRVEEGRKRGVFDKRICQPKSVKHNLLICQTNLTFMYPGFAIKGADFGGEDVEVVEAAVVAVGGSS